MGKLYIFIQCINSHSYSMAIPLYMYTINFVHMCIIFTCKVNMLRYRLNVSIAHTCLKIKIHVFLMNPKSNIRYKCRWHMDSIAASYEILYRCLKLHIYILCLNSLANSDILQIHTKNLRYIYFESDQKTQDLTYGPCTVSL